MASGPLETDLAHLRAERDALARQVEDLTGELAQARARISALEAEEAGPLALFDGGEDRLTGDGSDPRVLSMVLGATAVVAGMVALLALINGKLGTPFGIVMVVLTLALAWGAARTRVVPVEVSVVRGMVYVQQGESSYRFEVRKPETDVQMVGQPGDPGWQVRFGRRGLEPFVIDASMVDAHEFVAKLREFRPSL